MDEYIISYTAYDKDNNKIFKGKSIIRNKPNEFMAKVKLEEHLKKKHSNFSKMHIHSCEKQLSFDNLFKDILGDHFNLK